MVLTMEQFPPKAMNIEGSLCICSIRRENDVVKYMPCDSFVGTWIHYVYLGM